MSVFFVKDDEIMIIPDGGVIVGDSNAVKSVLGIDDIETPSEAELEKACKDSHAKISPGETPTCTKVVSEEDNNESVN